jgi:hypothetical protein
MLVPLPRELERFAATRKLPATTLNAYGVLAVQYFGRPALIYPTDIGKIRVKFLDGHEPKYTWWSKGGRAHWYGLKYALDLRKPGSTIYIVNGEPSVWACHAAGIPAICLCAGESTLPTAAVAEELIQIAGTFVVIYDTDRTGRSGSVALVRRLRDFGVDVVAADLSSALPGLHSGDVDDLHRRVGNQLGAVLASLPPLPEAGGGNSSFVEFWFFCDV